MTLQILKNSLKIAKNSELSPLFGRIQRITPSLIFANGLSPRLGDVVMISRENSDAPPQLGMVVVLDGENFGISPFHFFEGFSVNDRVSLHADGLKFPVGEELLGRVVNALGEPIDGGEILKNTTQTPIMTAPISPMQRGMIDEIFVTGVKTIDALLTCGRGQKIGIFAGSGGGKSTLLGMILRGAEKNISQDPKKPVIKIIALIGERGREVPEFIEKNLRGNLKNTVVIVATSDDSALMRKYGAFYAMSVAEFFKNRGQDVLFVMDSVTRFAMAQREIGLSTGEMPTQKGYPPSVFALLPRLMERAGKEKNKGTITAFFTILAEGDDMNDPIADQSRSILDGHFVLSREMAQSALYPPLDVLNSASRIKNFKKNSNFQDLNGLAQKFVKNMAILKENEVILRVGSYERGTDKELDFALSIREKLYDFMRQKDDEIFDFGASFAALREIFP